MFQKLFWFNDGELVEKNIKKLWIIRAIRHPHLFYEYLTNKQKTQLSKEINPLLS